MSIKSFSLKCLLIFIIFSCEGPEGEVGPAGKSSIVVITVEPAGATCATGGQKIQSGIDEDGDGQLSTSEIDQTQYVCNGKNGLVNVESEPASSNCTNGGLRIDQGVDDNGNNVLESSEVTQTKYLCGSNGLNTLTIYTDEAQSTNCLNGGFKIETGLDINSNLNLEPAEIQSTNYLCIPQTSDKLVRLELETHQYTRSLDWEASPYESFRLIRFDKRDYANVDSITFVTSFALPLDGVKLWLQLYNWTDEVEIRGSELSSSTQDFLFKESRNIYNELPDKEVALGIRMKTDNTNAGGGIGPRAYILIYKH